MKRFSVLLLCSFLCLFCFAGCGEGTDKYGFYSQRTLEKNLIPDLPKIQTGHMGDAQRFYFYPTGEEFEEYLQSVYDYLVGCSFEYFGYPTEVITTFFGGAPKCYFASGTELSDFQSNIAFYQSSNKTPDGAHYFFVWGNQGINEDSDGDVQIVNARYLQIGYYPDEGYVNAYMQLKSSLMDYTFYLLAD